MNNYIWKCTKKYFKDFYNYKYKECILKLTNLRTFSVILDILDLIKT